MRSAGLLRSAKEIYVSVVAGICLLLDILSDICTPHLLSMQCLGIMEAHNS